MNHIKFISEFFFENLKELSIEVINEQDLIHLYKVLNKYSYNNLTIDELQLFYTKYKLKPIQPISPTKKKNSRLKQKYIKEAHYITHLKNVVKSGINKLSIIKLAESKENTLLKKVKNKTYINEIKEILGYKEEIK